MPPLVSACEVILHHSYHAKKVHFSSKRIYPDKSLAMALHSTINQVLVYVHNSLLIVYNGSISCLLINQVLVYVYNSLLIVYNGSISCLFPYKKSVSSPSIAEHSCPTRFLVNFRLLHQFIVDTRIDTKKHS